MALVNLRKKGDPKVVPPVKQTVDTKAVEVSSPDEKAEKLNIFNAKLGAPFRCNICGSKHQNKDKSGVIERCVSTAFKKAYEWLNRDYTHKDIKDAKIDLPMQAGYLDAKLSRNGSGYGADFSVDYAHKSSFVPLFLISPSLDFRARIERNIRLELLSSKDFYQSIYRFMLNNDTLTELKKALKDISDKAKNRKLSVIPIVEAIENKDDKKLFMAEKACVNNYIGVESHFDSEGISSSLVNFVGNYNKHPGLIFDLKSGEDIYLITRSKPPLMVVRINLYDKYLPKILNVFTPSDINEDDDNYCLIEDKKALFSLIPPDSWEKIGGWDYEYKEF